MKCYLLFLCEIIVLKLKLRLEGARFVKIKDFKESNILDIIDFNKNTLLVVNKKN